MDELTKLMEEAGIDGEYLPLIYGYLNLLREKHEDTYNHVLRVARLSVILSDYADVPMVGRRTMLCAGLLHDIGKLFIPTELLNKTEKFDSSDAAAMEPHAYYGWLLMERIYPRVAHIIVRHHRYGKKPYPQRLPLLPDYLEPQRKTIDAASRLLALADYYDALTTRNNDRNGGSLTVAERRELFLRENSGFSSLVHKLELAGIFTFETK